MAVEGEVSQRAAETSRTTMVLALAPFALGYFLSYLYRATNAVVAPDLVRDVGLSASELGLLTAAYLLTFSLFQIPLGILLDRFGPRRVQAALVAIGGLGAALFGIGQSSTTLLIARAIIGLGFSGGLMASFKAVVIWVPEARRPLANSIVMSCGVIGLLVATAPLEAAVHATSWRTVFLGLSLFTLAAALLILTVVPERQVAASPAPVSLSAQVRELAAIYRDPVLRGLAPIMSITTGVHVAIQTLWAGPWLRDNAQLDRTAVANRLFVMAAAFLVGVLASGWIADRLARRGVSLLRLMLGFLGVFLVVQLGLILDIDRQGRWLWLLFGMTGSIGVLAFPWLSSYFGAALSGRANSAVNLPMFLLAFVFQYAIGWVIDLYPAPAAGGYAPEGYRMAFGLLLAIEVAALLWYFAHWRVIAAAETKVRAIFVARGR